MRRGPVKLKLCSCSNERKGSPSQRKLISFLLNNWAEAGRHTISSAYFSRHHLLNKSLLIFFIILVFKL